MVSSGTERKFKREFSAKHQENLKKCPLYPELVSQIREGKLFPAIREGCMDFYHRGHRALRRTQNLYKSNYYFLHVSRADGMKSQDVSVHGKDAHLSSILGRCKEKGKGEGLLLAKTYPFFSFAADSKNKDFPILIDIEARFAPLDKEKTIYESDKIDLVFLFPQTRELLFVEGKRRTDSRIRSKAGKPEVVGQVDGYREQLEKRESEILDAYKNAKKIMEDVFGFSFPEPTTVLKQVPILVVEDNNSDKDLFATGRAHDAWLEDELGKTEKDSYRKWSKDGALLLDGRSIFLDPENRMGDLAAGLNELADTIRKF